MASNSKEILANNLQKLMDRESITQKDIAVIAGVSQQSVSKMLGHTSISITADVYGHLYPSARKTVQNVL